MADYSDARNMRAATAQMAGLVLAPLAFGADLLISYMLVQHSCSTGHYYVLHVISAVCFLVALGGAFIAWQQYQLAKGGSDEGGTPLDRSHFLGLLGTCFSLFIALVIIANAVPRFFLSPCD